MKISVIIVNYNVKHFLEQCLLSVSNAMEDISGEIIVVDNNSNDNSKAYFQNRFKNVNFIWLGENLGFGKANNLAVDIARGEYVLFLNPDTLVPEECFSKCLQFIEADQSIGALGIKMIDGSGTFLPESKRANPSPVTSLFKLSGLSSLFPRSKVFAKYHLGYLDQNKNHEVDILAGAFMLIRKNILDKIGAFDEIFFMYGEDIDLSYRIKKEGYKNYYFADSSIIHFKGESTKKGSLNYVKMFYNAMSLFVSKHYKNNLLSSLFKIILQIGIWTKATISAISFFIKKIGVKIIDFVITFVTLFIIKIIWQQYIQPDAVFVNTDYLFFIGITSLTFLTTANFSGLYDYTDKPNKIFNSLFIGILVSLSIYAVISNNYRFSRGILLSGLVISAIFIYLYRSVLNNSRNNNQSDNDSLKNIVVVSENKSSFNHIKKLFNKSENKNNIINTNFLNLASTLEDIPSKDIIFDIDAKHITMTSVLEYIEKHPLKHYYNFHYLYSQSIIGSSSKNESGTTVDKNKFYKISSVVGKRTKRNLDTVTAALLLIMSPVLLFFMEKPFHFFANIFQVMFAKKTWVGYMSTSNDQLPALKPSVIKNNSMPYYVIPKALPENILKHDEQYAKKYTWQTDFKIIKKGFKYLGS
ncbi:glycosyltransferase family 2 protein [Polluticaenibacter yanchengensis]|uniref:Glycosyltransferase n=1 Tax=Polluticaenibacter yanchengensis TaxID=3014562 RepID=A0ABT4UJE9_9BACT|nr:glycosyltransferase [Chitinophagaceae bacterium LY-5]